MAGPLRLGISSPSLRTLTLWSVVRLTDSRSTCRRVMAKLRQSRSATAPIASSEIQVRTCWSLATMSASRGASAVNPDRSFRPGQSSRRTTPHRMSGACPREEPLWRGALAHLRPVWDSSASSSMTRSGVARMPNPLSIVTKHGTGTPTTSTRASNRRAL